MFTERENYLQAIKGGKPEWVPLFREACDVIVPSFLASFMATEEKVDMFGVKWEIDALAPMVSPKTELLEDIANWRQKVHLPDLSKIDWEKQVAFDTRNCSPDKARIFMAMGLTGQLFLPLMGMMGFEEGLCALVGDKEEVLEFHEEVTQFWVKLTKNAIEYYNPDVVVFGDDLANAKSLFMSPDVFREMYLPYYKRMFDVCRETGVHIEFHICGQAECIIDDLVEIGMGTWQVAQVTNDLLAIQKKYPNLAYNGVWDTLGPGAIPGASEEVARQSVRDCMDVYGQTGRLIFLCGTFGSSEEGMRRLGWVMDEAHNYGRTLYQK